MAKLPGSPPPPLVLKLKVPSPPLVCLCTVRLATAWLVKGQVPLDPAVVSAMLPPGQPPLELKPVLVNSATVTVTGALTVKAVVVTPPVGMTKVKVPIPLALKVKLPPPPRVFFCTVRLATAWLVKLQPPLDPGVLR